MSSMPDTSREPLLDPMARFDREERASREWRAWEQGRDDRPRVWWVNQGQEFANERTAGHIQAPVVDARGSHLKHWDALEEVEPDDLIVHCGRGYIRAVGRALRSHEQVTLADGRAARRVPVEYADLDPPVPLDAVAPSIHALQIPDGPLVQSGQYPKQGYLWPFSADGLRVIREASTAVWPEWSLAPDTSPPAWIFQANPERYDASAAVRELREISWSARQHGDTIRPGHRVFFWVSGADAGIVAVGTVLTAPALLPHDEAESRFILDPSTFQDVRPAVRVRIDEVLPERIRRSVLQEHPVLQDLSILQLARGTNFAVTAQQASALFALVAQQRPGGREPPLDRTPDVEDRPRTLDAILGTLAEKGLYFPAELVSNYLLALQTKRFVILTGISGTGKTQLALAVAQAFQPRVQVDAARGTAEGVVEQTVQPYMVKYHRLVLPAGLRANMTLPPLAPERSSSEIGVRYPGGQTTLRLNHAPDRPVIQVLFSGEFRDWFNATLQVGDRFLLDVVPGDGDGPDSLRFSLPVTEKRQAPLDNYRVIAVRPDWTDNRGLLGYHNPLTERYTTTPLLDLLLRAQHECDRAKREGGRLPYPFFAILDEMNLAHVEHYFSDFLSAMESGEPIDLHADAALEAGDGADGVPMPRQIVIPPNVFFTGTVNVDETTSMFSPKVLDRAFTIELDQVDLVAYGDLAGRNDALAGPSVGTGLRLGAFPGLLEPWRKPDADDWGQLAAIAGGALRQTILDLHALLARDHRHFGYRVANEIARFVTLAAEQAGDEPQVLWAALDLAILEKVLPKLHGTQQELEEPLRSLFTFFITRKPVAGSTAATDTMSWVLRGSQLVPVGGSSLANGTNTGDGVPPDVPPILPSPAFPRSAAKVWRMLERLRQQGFTSFIE